MRPTTAPWQLSNPHTGPLAYMVKAIIMREDRRKYLKLSFTTNKVSQKQYCILEMMAEIGAAVKRSKGDKDGG